MSDASGQDARPVPESRIHRRGFSWIWLIPIVALGIVAWLGFKHVQSAGPTISITFDRGEGLEAGKTQIKHKSVPVGMVKSVELSKDLSHVIVTAEMQRGVDDYLGKDTKFWVVRPRFNAGNISGLDTLVSGSYIVMRPAKGSGTSDFTGLENPPVDVQDVPGTRFTLHTEHLSTLDEGSTVYFRGIEVGMVLGYRLHADGKSLDIYIFVRQPYAKYVTDQTRFWSASAVDVSTSANGFEIKLQSVRALLAGGVVFDTPADPAGTIAKPDANFKLYDSQRESDSDPRGPALFYVMQFPGQLHGLHVNAPVELMGVPVGKVTAINQQVDVDTGQLVTPVTIQVDEAQMNLVQTGGRQKLTGAAAVNHAVDMLVRKGYRATMASGSLLTGQRFIQIAPVPDAPPAKLGLGGQAPEIPTGPAGTLDDLTASGTRVLSHLDAVLGNADRLVQNLVTLTGPGKNDLQDTVKSLNGTVQDLDRVLDNLDTDVRPLGAQLPQLLKELKQTARSANSLLDYVDQHPEALLLGRRADPSSAADQTAPPEKSQ